MGGVNIFKLMGMGSPYQKKKIVRLDTIYSKQQLVYKQAISTIAT
ncbi:hypothetical protein FORC087_004 (plasmid) [Bacillus cereus]|nr:hypothetical protein FORC087_004 [Bacillus cereus]